MKQLHCSALKELDHCCAKNDEDMETHDNFDFDGSDNESENEEKAIDFNSKRNEAIHNSLISQTIWRDKKACNH